MVKDYLMTKKDQTKRLGHSQHWFCFASLIVHKESAKILNKHHIQLLKKFEPETNHDNYNSEDMLLVLHHGSCFMPYYFIFLVICIGIIVYFSAFYADYH